MTKPFDQAAEEHFTPPEELNPDFRRWKYLINCAENQKGEKLAEEQLRQWSEDPNRMMECIFCQIVEPPSYFQLSDMEYTMLRRKGLPHLGTITCCPQCREYKGILPHIPDWSDLE